MLLCHWPTPLLQVPNSNQSQKDQRVARSHSLKETPACRKEKKEAQQRAGLPTSLKQKITNVLCPDRDDKDGGRVASHPPPLPPPLPTTSSTPAVQLPLYSALDSCLYHAAQGKILVERLDNNVIHFINTIRFPFNFSTFVCVCV